VKYISNEDMEIVIRSECGVKWRNEKQRGKLRPPTPPHGLSFISVTSAQTSAEVKKKWIYTATPPYVFMA
jgi:hypothetical protein